MCSATQRDHARLALTAAAAAKLLDISIRHFWKLNATARIPRPVRLGRSVRWQLRELEEWLQAGCPARLEWERRRASTHTQSETAPPPSEAVSKSKFAAAIFPLKEKEQHAPSS